MLIGSLGPPTGSAGTVVPNDFAGSEVPGTVIAGSIAIGCATDVRVGPSSTFVATAQEVSETTSATPLTGSRAIT